MRAFGIVAAGLLVLLSACASKPAEVIKTVYVPVMVEKPPPPSSLSPQPILLFDITKRGRKLYTLNDEFPYCDSITGKVIVVPKWYVTDFASVPWYGQGVINPQGATARAAIVHDWLYAIGEPGKRQEADEIFYRAMKKFGVSEVEARIAYNAVRAGGERGYGRPEDWAFINPSQPSKQQPPPFAKPRTGSVMFMQGCRGFEKMIADGWKAYYKPQRVAVPVTTNN